jgi:BTB/POZ domain
MSLKREEAIRAEVHASIGVKSPAGASCVHWRENPDKTLSDWKLVVVSTADRSSTTYHVHRHILEHGTGEGGYFARMFSGRFSDNNSQSSELLLHPLAARAFPKLLDFIYGCTNELQIDTGSATALLYLGDYFFIPQVCGIAEQFIQKDIALGNLATYASHSSQQLIPMDPSLEISSHLLLPVDPLLEILATFVAENLKLGKLYPSDPFVPVLPLRVWERVVEKINLAEDEDQCNQFSKLFAQFGSSQTGPLDGVVAERILSRIPFIHPNAALNLAELSQKLDHGESSSKLLEQCAIAFGKLHRLEQRMQEKITSDRVGKLPGSFYVRAIEQFRHESATERPAIQQQRNELHSTLEPFNYQAVLIQQLEMEEMRRKDLNGTISDLRTKHPELTLDDIMDTDSYQCMMLRYDVQREVFDSVLERKWVEIHASNDAQELAQPSSKRCKRESASGRSDNGKDLYPVNKRFFLRDPHDGFGGHEYPVKIIQKLPGDQRRITFVGWGTENRDVHVSELLEWTKERERIYQEDTKKAIKENQRALVETQRQQGATAVDQDTVQEYQEGKEYFLRCDGIERPVVLVQICPRARFKGKIRYREWKKPLQERKELRLLLPVTAEREKAYRDCQALSEQTERAKADQKRTKKKPRQHLAGNKRKRSTSA